MPTPDRMPGRRAGGLATLLLAAAAACSSGTAAPRDAAPRGTFAAAVTGLVDTLYTGEATLLRGASGGGLRLAADGGGSAGARIAVSGGWSQFAPGTHPFGDRLMASYEGHGRTYRAGMRGTLTVTEWTEARLAGHVDGWAFALATGGTPDGGLRFDSLLVRAEFVIDGDVATDR